MEFSNIRVAQQSLLVFISCICLEQIILKHTFGTAYTSTQVTKV